MAQSQLKLKESELDCTRLVYLLNYVHWSLGLTSCLNSYIHLGHVCLANHCVYHQFRSKWTTFVSKHLYISLESWVFSQIIGDLANLNPFHHTTKITSFSDLQTQSKCAIRICLCNKKIICFADLYFYGRRIMHFYPTHRKVSWFFIYLAHPQKK